MPEGLILFSTMICDIVEQFTTADTVIMGKATYGACCVDDFTAKALRVDLLIHYGHSCLIPVDQMSDIKLQVNCVNWVMIRGVKIPQSRPLSPGEVLGCTAPTIREVDALVYLGYGRFHLQAAMIANPNLKTFKEHLIKFPVYNLPYTGGEEIIPDIRNFGELHRSKPLMIPFRSLASPSPGLASDVFALGAVGNRY
ncbi:unnamed protein product [Nezara viridula]|uniref:2-(3-amino-3-carboxypropyl)histidine synthase subunit 1 n=1 Tax=Nezara viridula TaxID=85310 RepID=A0A9P0MJF1_NEZVI|nr:unnamed protein product [Nezara viridula]